jgi:hypothetical protein
MESGEEAKLKALRECLQGEQFRELTDKGQTGVLLIFTEHRDTLDYLRQNLRAWGYSTCEIHGGMNAVQRREAAQRFFDTDQICLATEAAGEGINLQFCHLMINYDIPWNPNRLEQRMGRIHRIGQKRDVYIFNFVADNTVEGTILTRLFTKLEDIRKDLGDRVFDVVGQLLMLNEIRLEDMLREVAINRNRVEEYTGRIEQLSPEQLKQLEDATGVALATSQVDLSWVKGVDIRSQERRLMPEYVQKFFLRAAERENMHVRQRPNGLFSIERVPAALRDPQLVVVRRNGKPEAEYRYVTFDKAIQQNETLPNATLLSPGHPLFAALTEVLLRDLETIQGQYAIFVDPRATESYQVHFFEVQIISEEPAAESRHTGGAGEERTQVLYATLVALLDRAGSKELAPADLLHDLTSLAAQQNVMEEALPALHRCDDQALLAFILLPQIQQPRHLAVRGVQCLCHLRAYPEDMGILRPMPPGILYRQLRLADPSKPADRLGLADSCALEISQTSAQVVQLLLTPGEGGIAAIRDIPIHWHRARIGSLATLTRKRTLAGLEPLIGNPVQETLARYCLFKSAEVDGHMGAQQANKLARLNPHRQQVAMFACGITPEGCGPLR